MNMQSSHGAWAKSLETIVNRRIEEGSAAWATPAVPEIDAVPRIPAHEIFAQTERGAAVAASRRADLPDRLRTLLFLINGRRRMSEYRDLLPRYRNIDGTFDMLARKGYIERLSEDRRA